MLIQTTYLLHAKSKFTKPFFSSKVDLRKTNSGIYRNIIFSKFLYIRQLNNPEYVFQRLNQVNTPLDKFIIKIYLKTL